LKRRTRIVVVSDIGIAKSEDRVMVRAVSVLFVILNGKSSRYGIVFPLVRSLLFIKIVSQYATVKRVFWNKKNPFGTKPKGFQEKKEWLF